jgi:hypothetical protein
MFELGVAAMGSGRGAHVTEASRDRESGAEMSIGAQILQAE